MVEPLRHRQTKEAATDMFYLTPPRHISTYMRAPLSRGISVAFSDLDSSWLRIRRAVKSRSREAVRRRRRA